MSGALTGAGDLPVWWGLENLSELSLPSHLDTVLHTLGGQLARYRYGRVLSTLTDEFPGFEAALEEHMFEVARRQAASMPGQPLPSGLTVEDITSFNYTSFYSQLQTSVPMLHSVVRGSMAGHFTFHEVPWRYPFGGSGRQRRISLQSTICQIISAVMYSSHPRKMALLPAMNSVFGALRHVDGQFHNFLNLHGTAVSKKSALLAIDNMTNGRNVTVTSWKEEVEHMQDLASQRLRRTAAAGGVHGYTFGIDNVGYVRRSRHVDKKEKKSEYIKMAIAIAVKNRVPSAHMSDEPCVKTIDDMLHEGKFFPSKQERLIVKEYVVFNMKYWLTAHLQPLHRFRSSVRAPDVPFPKKMTEKSDVEILDLFLVDPASNSGMIEIGKFLTDMTPKADAVTGRRVKVVCHEDQGMEERHWKCNFSLSGERDPVERCDGGIPLTQGFHREIVDNKIWMDRFLHGAEKAEPGSVSNIKNAFHHNNADRSCKNVYASYDLTENTTIVNFISYAKLKLDKAGGTIDCQIDFDKFAEELFEELNNLDKFAALDQLYDVQSSVIGELASDVASEVADPAKWAEVRDFTHWFAQLVAEENEEAEMEEAEMEEAQRNLELHQDRTEVGELLVADYWQDKEPGLEKGIKEADDEVLDYRKDLIFTGLLLAASKTSTRFGDGPAQLAIWKLMLPDYWDTGHYKYGISSIRKSIAASGAMGRRVAADSTYNTFVNTKGKSHTNLHIDLHVEHTNGKLKEGISHAGGNHSVETLRRQAKTLNLQELLGQKLMPAYTDDADGVLGERKYYGHGTADFTDNVAEAVEMMEDYLERVPGRKRKTLYEKKDCEKENQPDAEDKQVARKESLLAKKNWSGRLVTVDPGVFAFVGRHAKEMKRYIEATY